jgi:glutamate/tyrosine decarboxylase-like PLP-dependent enzyme
MALADPPPTSVSSRADLLLTAAERAAQYIRTAADRPVNPGPGAVDALVNLGGPLPAGPSDPAEVVARLDRYGSPATVVSTHGRYFGFVNGGTDPAAGGAAVLSGAWDQNIASPVMSPTAAFLDSVAAGWVLELLGLPATATAVFSPGASTANLTGVLAARDALLARQGWSVDERGLHGAPPIKVVTSAEIHISVLKALRAAGIGREAISWVSTDACGRIRPEAFPAVDHQTLVILQAGNVNTGHSDPFADVIGPAHDAGAWVHIDGAFGLWAAASSRRPLVAGVEQADSWATDAHKWLNAPYDSGIAICARAEDLRRALATDAAYVATQDQRALMHLGLQMSQRARGIETWAIIASRGRSGIAAMIDRTCDLAARFADRLRAAGVEILAPVVLNQALARFGDDATTDAVITAVQLGGTCWAGGTTWQGRRAMRLSVSDVATTEADIDRSADAMVAAWHRVTGR